MSNNLIEHLNAFNYKLTLGIQLNKMENEI